MRLSSDSLSAVHEVTWDAIVIGAGVAGCVAALHLARRGRRVLLVDAKPSPRPKVCGGCMSALGWSMLKKLGVADVLQSAGVPTVDSLTLHYRSKQHRLDIPSGIAVSREVLDPILLAAAEAAGVSTLLETRATVLDDAEMAMNHQFRRVRLATRNATAQHESEIASAKVVIAADGLGSPSLASLQPFECVVSRRSRIGLGAVVEGHNGTAELPPATITMLIHRHGYIGLAYCENNRVSIASAIDAKFLAQFSTPAAALQSIAGESGHAIDRMLTDVKLVGTKSLTQRQRFVACDRLFVIGDAASYVEPFTGEGMTSAMVMAEAVTELAHRGIDDWSRDYAKLWQSWVGRHRRYRQLSVRMLTGGLRSGIMTASAFNLLTTFPAIGRAVAHAVCRPTIRHPKVFS